MPKDHQIRELINDLRDELVKRGPSIVTAQCLRDVIAAVVERHVEVWRA